MGLKDRITKLEDLRVGLVGPLVGKFHAYGQTSPAFSFTEAVQDVVDAEATLRSLGLEVALLPALALDLRFRYPQADNREVSELVGCFSSCIPPLFSFFIFFFSFFELWI